jgi:hypothetical protein
MFVRRFVWGYEASDLQSDRNRVLPIIAISLTNIRCNPPTSQNRFVQETDMPSSFIKLLLFTEIDVC